MKGKMNLLLLLLFSVSTSLISCDSSSNDVDNGQGGENEEQSTDLDLSITIPAGPNSWVINSTVKDRDMISEEGIHNWTSNSDVVRIYFHLENSGELHLGLNAKSPDGLSKIKATVGDESKEVTLTPTDYNTVDIGSFEVSAGYNYVELQGLEKTGSQIGDVNDILLGGPASAGTITSVPLSNAYFGRRGPSVNIGYDTPDGKEVEYFYNEVTVPEGEDVVGSFFMANGHSQGYFGIQVNSETERRVLFSIWSAFSTDDPNQIPEDYKVTNLGKGAGVTVQDFGNEGSGKQSFKLVDWKTDVTYKFLLKAVPSENNSTDYTAWFMDPEVGQWELIASLRRPKTSTYLTGLYSFLENFNPSTGHLQREAKYGNQWAYTTDNEWNGITSGSFRYDATADNGDRLDYAGEVSGDAFVLRNCGFFNENTTYGVTLSRDGSSTPPAIDFEALPQPTPPAPPVSVITLDRNGWTVTAESEETSGEGDTGLAADLLDGDDATYWHSCWTCSPAAAYPHEILIDMQSDEYVEGVAFKQRTSLSRAVEEIELLTSSDNNTFESAGTFQLENEAGQQLLEIPEGKTFRYLKVIMTSAHDGQQFAAMSEIAPFVFE